MTATNAMIFGQSLKPVRQLLLSDNWFHDFGQSWKRHISCHTTTNDAEIFGQSWNRCVSLTTWKQEAVWCRPRSGKLYVSCRTTTTNAMILDEIETITSMRRSGGSRAQYSRFAGYDSTPTRARSWPTTWGMYLQTNERRMLTPFG